eukprot:gene4709-6816_t
MANQSNHDDVHVVLDDDTPPKYSEEKGSAKFESGFDINSLTAAVGSQILQSSSKSASKLASTYGRIDVLRPYFDLEPKDLRQRLLNSLWPTFSRQPKVIAIDLYGPTMIALTLSAVLLLSMKHSGHVLRREGTLIGTSFAVSFGYWVTLTGIMYAFGFVFNTNVTILELLTVTGYSLFSYCIVLLTSHTMTGHLDFYMAWLIFGLMGSLRLGGVLRSRTPDTKQGVFKTLSALLEG